VSRSGTTAERASQGVYVVPQLEKPALLLALLVDSNDSVLVFTRTKRRADKLMRVVERGGHAVERIHADRSQSQRRHALDGFKSGKYRVLIATDIASRGLDVEEIGHVVNFDVPHVPEDYVHRVGRTARAAASGKASTFAAPEEFPLLKEVERLLQAVLPRLQVPKESRAFRSELERADRARKDPGPRQVSSGARDPSRPLGRHARTHPKRRPGEGKAQHQGATDNTQARPPHEGPKGDPG
jgi:ATP-dependent RNA helicase RhlE